MGFEVKEEQKAESNFTVPPEKMPKKKKKGLHGFAKFIVIFCSVIVAIPLILVGTVYACFYDPSHKEIPTQENFTKENMINNLLVDSLDTANTSEHTIKMGLKTNDINQLLKGAIANNAQLSQFVKNLYVDTDLDTVAVVLELDTFGIFKTNAQIDMHYEYQVENGDATLVFQIVNVRVGRINGMHKVLEFTKQFFQLPDVSDIFAKSGLRINVDLNNLRMTYKVNDFCEDVVNMLGSSEGFMVLVKELLTNQAFSAARSILGPDPSQIFSFGFYLPNLKVTSALHGIENYEIPDGYFTSQLTYVTEKVKGLLDQGKIVEEQGDSQTLTQKVDVVAKYIMGGDKLFSSPDPYIEKLKSEGAFNGMTIPQYNYDLPEEKKLPTILNSRIPTTLPVTGSISVEVNTKEFNESLSTTPATGVINSFIRNVGTDETLNYKVNYVCTDRIGVVVNNNTLYLVVNMNVNGYDVHLTFDCPRDNDYDAFGKAKFNMQNMYFGDFQVSREVMEQYKDVISSALGGEGMGSVITFDKASGGIMLDIGSILSSKGITESMANVTIETLADTTLAPGAIKITMEKK